MRDQNIVILIGRFTRDPELRSTSTGKSVVDFSLANSDDYGETKHTNFFNCEAWGKTAELIQQYCHKGQQVSISGKLRHDTWEDQDGKKRSAVKIVVSDIQFLSGKKESDGKQAEDHELFENQKPFDSDSIPF